ncbi:hypothetical protein BQ9231_00449 [Cedratvirus lausannensis]|uniref:Uncharacterized protein n=1 Tax=Cedratvirus lausannensis TaxID=2023205 RepID=A0A285PYP9_9VIRU|nr:hypothetical protein BQ9231_00449 [Cedratvirus lausannensis]
MGDISNPLEKAREFLHWRGPDPSYVVVLDDPDNKINYILGLNEENLELAREIKYFGSISTFAEADEDRARTMLENGFQATLVERALAGIHNTDNQRLIMFLGLIASSLEIREERENNHTALAAAIDLTQPYNFYEFQRWMTHIDIVEDNSFLYANFRPEYDVEEVKSALEEILPGLKFYIRRRTLIIPITDLQQRIFPLND